MSRRRGELAVDRMNDAALWRRLSGALITAEMALQGTVDHAQGRQAAAEARVVARELQQRGQQMRL